MLKEVARQEPTGR